MKKFLYTFIAVAAAACCTCAAGCSNGNTGGGNRADVGAEMRAEYNDEERDRPDCGHDTGCPDCAPEGEDDGHGGQAGGRFEFDGKNGMPNRRRRFKFLPPDFKTGGFRPGEKDDGLAEDTESENDADGQHGGAEEQKGGPDGRDDRAPKDGERIKRRRKPHFEGHGGGKKIQPQA